MLQSDMKAERMKGSALACGTGRLEGTVKVHGRSYCIAWALCETRVNSSHSAAARIRLVGLPFRDEEKP